MADESESESEPESEEEFLPEKPPAKTKSDNKKLPKKNICDIPSDNDSECSISTKKPGSKESKVLLKAESKHKSPCESEEEHKTQKRAQSKSKVAKKSIESGIEVSIVYGPHFYHFHLRVSTNFS